MLKEERQRQLLEILHSKGRVEISELCQLFNVTTMTVRRDLDELEHDGLLLRSRGGALLANANILVEHPFNIRLNENKDKKNQIAKYAAETVFDGRRIYMGSGSTMLYMAKNIPSSRRIIVVTDAVNIASELLNRPSVSVIMIGGDLRSNTFSAVGAFAENMVKQFKCQYSYIGVTGIGSDGTLYVTSVAEAGLFKTVFEHSSAIYILADSTKLGVEDFVSIGQLQKNYTLITNRDADPELVQSYKSLGADVLLV